MESTNLPDWNSSPKLLSLPTETNFLPQLQTPPGAQQEAYGEKHFTVIDSPHRGRTLDGMGNPLTLGISVFAVTNTMIALFLMQARGIQHTDVQLGMLWFTGGLASWLTAIFELFRGDTFAWTVFGSFGGYYFAYASVLTPAFQIGAGYPAEQLEQQLGVFYCCWAALFLVFLVVSVRTNLVYVYVFATVDVTTWLLAAKSFQIAAGNVEMAVKLTNVAGGFLFACSMAGWYLLVLQLAEALGFGFKLPLGILVKDALKDEEKGRKASTEMEKPPFCNYAIPC